MSTDFIRQAMQQKQSTLQVKKVKDTFSVMVRFNFKNDREKQIAEDFKGIAVASGLSDNAVAIELIEAGIAQLAKETQ